MADRAMLASTYLNEQLPAGPYVYLEVSDTGCGMDAATSRPDLRAVLHDQVHRAAGSAWPPCWASCAATRARSRSQSAPGMGTTFRVLLPASTGTAERGRRRDRIGPRPRAPGWCCWSTTKRPCAGSRGACLNAAATRSSRPPTARTRSARWPTIAASVRAVVLDLTMPGLGGEATLQRIRQDSPRLPVIVSSGYVPEEGGTLAGVPFLAKPYRPSELVDAVKKAIDASS